MQPSVLQQLCSLISAASRSGKSSVNILSASADSLACSIISLHAGFSMFKAGLNGVLFSPTSFFDTTPMGASSMLVR
jgi:hypothetical protein